MKILIIFTIVICFIDFRAKEFAIGALILITIVLGMVTGHLGTKKPGFKWDTNPPTLLGVLDFIIRLAAFVILTAIFTAKLEPRLIHYYPKKSWQFLMIETFILLPPYLLISYAFDVFRRWITKAKD